MVLGWAFAKFYPELDTKKRNGTLTNGDKVIFALGWLLDVFLNVTMMNLVFLPDWYPREYTISERIARLANAREHPASDRAYWIYWKFLHETDPGHAGVIIRD